MAKPVFICTPGAWHTVECFGKVTRILEEKGFEVHGVNWPSIVRAPVFSTDDDIATIREAVSKEADGGNDVIVICHSWSAAPVNSAVADLSKAEREKQGKKGGVVKLVFLCAFVVPEGVSMMDAVGGKPSALWNIQVHMPLPIIQSTNEVTLQGDVVYPNDPIHHFYQDIPEPDQKYWASKLTAISMSSINLPTTGAAYKAIPSHYLICEDDNAIPSFAQEAMVKAAQEAGADMKVDRMKSGHSPFLSHPEETADFLIKAAS